MDLFFHAMQHKAARAGVPLAILLCLTLACTCPLLGIKPTENNPTTSPSSGGSLPTENPATPSIPQPPPTVTITVPTALPEPSGKIVFTCQISGLSEFNDICLMNADGSQFRQVTSNDANNSFPSLSPDGRSIVYTSNLSGIEQVYILDLAGGIAKQLTFPPGDGTAPEISPDGNTIVYKHGDELDRIWVMNRDGSNPHQVYYLGWDPTWSPDGRQVLFASGSLSAPQLFAVDLDGTHLRQVTTLDNLRGRSDWSSTGLIATYAGIKPYRNIFVMNADGSNLVKIDTGGDSLAPSFSPDGNWITFMSYRDHPGDGDGCEIYIMRVDGSDIRRLTNNSYCDWQPRWGP